MSDYNSSAIVRIMLPHREWQTGWFFNKNGQIMTAGHGFATTNNPYNIIYEIELESGTKLITAKLNNYEYVPEAGLDYAILTVSQNDIVRLDYYNQPYIPITSFRQKHVNSSFVTAGFASDLSHKTLMEYRGIILGKIILLNNHYWIDISPKSSHSWMGLSGAPILINGRAVGLQSSQFANARDRCLATPILKIKNALVRNSLSQGANQFNFNLQEFVKRTNLVTLPLPNQAPQYALFLTDRSASQNDLHGAVTNHQYLKNLHEKAHELAKEFVNPDNYIFLEQNKFRVGLIQRNDETNLLFYLKEWWGKADIATQPYKTGLRVLIDIDGEIIGESSTIENINSYMEIPYCVGIWLKRGDGGNLSFKFVHRVDFDFSVEIYFPSDAKPETLRLIIHTLLIDLYLDHIFFITNPILRTLFSTVSNRRAFVSAKATFCREQSLLVYGQALPASSYVSFASCVRSTVNEPLNQLKYKILWDNFLNSKGGLFNILQLNMDRVNLLPAEHRNIAEYEEIVTQLRKTKDLGGQLSERGLINALKKYTGPKDETMVFVIFVKSARSKLEKKFLKTFFGCTRLKLNSYKFIAFSELPNITDYVNLLRFHLFFKR